MGSEMKIELPTQLIEDTIRAEMVRQIGGDNRDKLIEAVVKTAMTQKKDTYSSTPTYFQEAVNKMIRDVAYDVFKKWLDGNRAAIGKALFAHLNGDKQKRLKEFAEKIADNITRYGITVDLNLGRDD